MEGVSFLFLSVRISQWSKVFPATAPSCPHPCFQTMCSQKDIWFQWKLSWHPCNMLGFLLCASWEGWGLLRGFWVIGLVASSCQEIKRQPWSSCCCMGFNGFVFIKYSASSRCQKCHYWRHPNEKKKKKKEKIYFSYCKIPSCLKTDGQPTSLSFEIGFPDAVSGIVMSLSSTPSHFPRHELSICSMARIGLGGSMT